MSNESFGGNPGKALVHSDAPAFMEIKNKAIDRDIPMARSELRENIYVDDALEDFNYLPNGFLHVEEM